jgi:hypothetical protein
MAFTRMRTQIKEDKGKLDIVFANAGVAKYAPRWARSPKSSTTRSLASM